MVDAEPIVKQLLHLLVSRLAKFATEKAPLRMLFAAEVLQGAILHGGVFERKGAFDCLLASVHKYHHLMTAFNNLRNLLINDVVQVLA